MARARMSSGIFRILGKRPMEFQPDQGLSKREGNKIFSSIRMAVHREAWGEVGPAEEYEVPYVFRKRQGR